MASSASRVTSGFLRLEVRSGDELGEARLIALVTSAAHDEEMVAGVPMLEDAGSTHTLILHVAQSPQRGVFHGLAILNLSGRENSVAVQAFDPNGRKTAEVTLLLPPRNRVVGLLNEPAFFGPSFEQEGGFLRVLSARPVASFSLFGGAGFLSTIEGQPVFNARAYDFLHSQ